PTCRRNSVLKLPSEVKPTSKQMSVMGRLETVSNSLARSMRNRVRNSCGVSPKAARNARRKCHGESPASWLRSANVISSSRQSNIRSRVRQRFRNVRDDGMAAPGGGRMIGRIDFSPNGAAENSEGRKPWNIDFSPNGAAENSEGRKPWNIVGSIGDPDEATESPRRRNMSVYQGLRPSLFSAAPSGLE